MRASPLTKSPQPCLNLTMGLDIIRGEVHQRMEIVGEKTGSWLCGIYACNFCELYWSVVGE